MYLRMLDEPIKSCHAKHSAKRKKIMSRRTSNVKSIKKTLKNQKAKKVLKKTKKNKKEYNFIFLPSKQNQTSQLLTLN